MDTLLKNLSAKLFEILHVIDNEANTPVGKRTHAGLGDYSVYKGLDGRRYEKSWNDRIAELLSGDDAVINREYRYPDSRKKCDLFIEGRESTKIWLEVKSAWKYWFSSRTGKIEKNKSQFYQSYLVGNRGNGLKKTHSAAQDIEKLSLLDPYAADYVCLIIIGFDVAGDPVTSEIMQLIEQMELKKKKWHIFGPEIWSDRSCPDCRYDVWFMGKKASI